MWHKLVAAGLIFLGLSGEVLAGADSKTSSDQMRQIQQVLPTFTRSVEGTGVSGLDFVNCKGNLNCGWFIRQAPVDEQSATQPPLRVQREASYSGGKTDNVASTIWALTYTSPRGRFYEWDFNAELHNRTGGGAANGNGAQNVAVAGTAFKEFSPTFAYGADQIGPTWGGYFICDDKTKTKNPAHSCIGAEIDSSVTPGAGTDNNKQRVILQLGCNGGGAGDHCYTGILMGAAPEMTLDHGVSFTTGHFGTGIDFSQATNPFETAAIQFKPNQGFAWTGAQGSYTPAKGQGLGEFVAADDTWYHDNYNNTPDVFRGPDGDVRFELTSVSINLPKEVRNQTAEDHAITTKSAPFTFDAKMANVSADAKDAPIVGTPPTCDAASRGRHYGLKKLDRSSHAVSYAARGSDTIDGTSTASTKTQYDVITVTCSDVAGRWDRGF